MVLYLLDESSLLESAVGRPSAGSQPSLATRHTAPPILSYAKYPDTAKTCLCTLLASIDSPEFNVVYFTPSARVLFPFKP